MSTAASTRGSHSPSLPAPARTAIFPWAVAGDSGNLDNAVRIYTIGHSNRTFDELAGLLEANGVQLVADVRTAPGSRRLPHFTKASLEVDLPQRGIGYVHLRDLGGLRKPRPGSPHTGWRDASFRGYADHMEGAGWRAALDVLIELGRERTVAAMCAEAVPWRCHRSLLADALVARGVEVLHIVGAGRPRTHSMTPFAVVDGDRIAYPAPDTLPLDG